MVGVLRMRVFLSGMPECKLGLNDKVLFENQVRQCSDSPVGVRKGYQARTAPSKTRDSTGMGGVGCQSAR